MTHYPLPKLGLCEPCGQEIRLRKTGALYAHGCAGDGEAPYTVLAPTFARWLHSHAARRDDRTNRITNLAQMEFRGCTRSPHRTPADVAWKTAEELHARLHQVQLQRTGSEIRQPYDGQRCDRRCRDVERASAVYAELVATTRPSPPWNCAHCKRTITGTGHTWFGPIPGPGQDWGGGAKYHLSRAYPDCRRAGGQPS
ncbi:hypothetical protein J7I98_23760 [Streptomyces sp. ISL-98]|uniref:hypothetical protein n=1 Tax=Streptomyces sp. ISL-98 TaxID=2819192 RepID=UPI001BE650F6|nr:hypothetical protein [Streptomyces sp. ISL-98]MBT2508847.1 hypothetical protein [Streptomyces sp. ISL-98]